jgi:hemerythrin-like domain-containing protein
MRKVDNWLLHDHSQHEELLERCQEAVEIEDWDTADSAFRELYAEMKWHITQEEEVVYPAYEAEVGAPDEPTAALRAEHHKIIDFMKDLREVFGSRDSEHVLDCLAQLEQLMIKHHEKEEDIFLPMASRILEGNRDAILGKLNAFNAAKKK